MISLAADVGKTNIRLLMTSPGAKDHLVEFPSPVALGGDGASTQMVDAIVSHVADLGIGTRTAEFAIGLAGAGAWPQVGQLLFEALKNIASKINLTVTSDAVVAHLSALQGRAGTLLIAGTGTVALSLETASPPLFKDGHGPRFGDDGSGAWIGTEGLKAAIRSFESRGTATALTAMLERRTQRSMSELVSQGNESINPARWAGQFAPDVLRAWGEGDLVAGQIVERALQMLTLTAVAANRYTPRLAVTGGLTVHATFAEALVDSISRAVPEASVFVSTARPIEGAQFLLNSRQAHIEVMLGDLVQRYPT